MDFVRSPNFTDTGAAGRKVDLVVLHTMEAAEKGETAEAIANFFARPTTRASAHYCFDNNSVVQCVKEEDVAWAAPGGNHDGIQIEMAGFARQTADDWADEFSRAMLDLVVPMTAEICDRWDIPLVWLRAPDLAAGRRGVTDHDEVSKAFRLSTHWDVGTGFQVQDFMAAVQAVTPKPPPRPAIKPPPPTLRKGDTGWRVKQAQKLLRAANQKLNPDGVFGYWTERAVLAFQRRAGLRQDGIIGTMTWRALWQHYYLVR